ncbi:hypothetical protein A3860_04920 [Niastella vici]|uniref:Lipocalin-like domain-containing protein n=1 Tax=Niastella vici TaxID=1703345 RepID=A0A1V9FRU0_9BACT|nr:hypothetical protein A3860_04920 [Niastella vici]
MSLIVNCACKSAKVSKGQPSNNIQTAASGKCDQVIKYYSEKATGKDGNETTFNTEIIIDPSAKVISLASSPPNQEPVKFNMKIESIDCNLSPDLTTGQSIYKVYINKPDGTTTLEIIRLEAKDGYITISGDPEKESAMIIIVSKWEVVRS